MPVLWSACRAVVARVQRGGEDVRLPGLSSRRDDGNTVDDASDAARGRRADSAAVGVALRGVPSFRIRAAVRPTSPRFS